MSLPYSLNFIGESGVGVGIQLIQKQGLMTNAILLILNDAIFIKTNMKKQNFKNKSKLTWEEKMTPAGMIDSYLFKGPKDIVFLR